MEESFNYSNSIKDALISELVASAFKSVTTIFKKDISKKIDNPSDDDFENRIVSHFNEMYNWCKNLEFIGLGGIPISTITKSIELKYSYSLKSRFTLEPENIDIVETDLIFSEGNIIIVGDPGSGKTTTLKRLLYNYFLSQEKVQSPFSYPLLIRFRSLGSGFNLYTHIANFLGLKYETEEEQYEAIEDQRIEDTLENGDIQVKIVKVSVSKKRPIYFFKGVRIETVIINLLEQNSVLIIMDGLDELMPDLFDNFKKQLQELSLKLLNSKMIITSRPNYIDVAYHNFALYEVNPLTTVQINAISKLWLLNSDNFLKELESKSYYELANRPLFLTFLILLYKVNENKRKSALPKYSRDVYEQIVELLLSKWDKDRDIERSSKYANFDERRKFKFLSHLAFRLTYITKTKIFSHKELVDAYLLIHHFFDLPKNEAELVAEEIENHTGVITKSLYNKYEFSHLAIQEYLCAVYILNAPFNEKIIQYLREYPSPLAFAVSLSSDPSLWLSELIIKMSENIKDKGQLSEISAKILSRLILESPYFENISQIVLSLLLLCNKCNLYNKDFTLTFEKFLKANSAIEKELFNTLELYTIKGKVDNEVTLFRRKIVSVDNYPTQFYFPQYLYSYLLSNTP